MCNNRTSKLVEHKASQSNQPLQHLSLRQVQVWQMQTLLNEIMKTCTSSHKLTAHKMIIFYNVLMDKIHLWSPQLNIARSGKQEVPASISKLLLLSQICCCNPLKAF